MKQLGSHKWPWVAMIACGVVGVLALAGAGQQSEPKRTADAGYRLVAPPAAIHATLKANLKIVNDWLGNRDMASAAETADGLIVLATIYQRCSDETNWQEKSAALRATCQNLVARARAKDAAGCEQASKQCADLLEELGQIPVRSEKVAATDAKPTATNRSLMKLLDGCYADAKMAKTASDRANYLFAIAEVSNLTQFLLNDAVWKERSVAVRDEALRLANAKPDDDLKAARQELKNVYDRCQDCHLKYKPK